MAATKPNRYTKESAQNKLIERIAEGWTIGDALAEVDRSRKAYEAWRAEAGSSFKFRVDQAKASAQVGRHNEGVKRGERLPFEEWRRKYLGSETFWHQLQWIDLLEGREPRELHKAQTYTQGKRTRILINTPPFHAKSMTLTVDYATYRLCMNPSFRIIIVSETSRLAEDFLFAIKQRLTHPDYLELQKAYAPEGGWKQTAESWKQNRIVVGAGGRSGEEKDPSVQTLGIRGQIYGSRADMVLVDDAVTGKNVREYEHQMTWLRREVSSRLEAGGKLIIVGTRIAPTDLYSELMNPDNYARGASPWTHMASPAILEEGDTWDEHVTLWPLADRRWEAWSDGDECDCAVLGEEVAARCRDGVMQPDGTRLFPRWDGNHMELMPRADNNAAEFALVYQQTGLGEHMTFPEHAVRLACNNQRMSGLLDGDKPGHPPQGMHRMHVIGSVDPSIKGYAGVIVGCVDRTTRKRYVLTASNLKAPSPEELKDEMKRLTQNYAISEWRVEKTGLLQFFTQDQELRIWMANRGVRFREHTTGANKWDPSYGVASMAGLFGAYDRNTDAHGETNEGWRCIAPPLIELPRPINDAIRSLIHQLVIWTPDLDPKRVPCDLVMALWFFEIACRDAADRPGADGAVNPLRRATRFMSPRDRKKRLTVNLAEARLGR